MAKHKTEAEQYRERVYDWLNKVDAGTYDLSKLVKSENVQSFIAIIKQYMDEMSVNDNGFDLTFSEDYMRLRKTDLILK